MTSAWDPFNKLIERIKETVEPLGLSVLNTAFIPADRGTPVNIVHVAFDVDRFALMNPDQQQDLDALKGIMDATRIAERDEKHRQAALRAREGLLGISKSGLFPEEEGNRDGD